MLSAEETQAAQSLLAAAGGGGERARVVLAEKIWDRNHILRLTLADGRTAVLKRHRTENAGDRRRGGFQAELTALEFLNAMEPAVAPRLLGADTGAGILIMEDLGPAASLADSLLARDRARAQAGLVAYGRALGTMHAWSLGRPGRFAELEARHAGSPGPGARPREPDWASAIARGKDGFLLAAARLARLRNGAITAVSAEIDSLGAMLRGRDGRYTGLVHSDACPDNTHITGGACRIFDFETSGWGSVALDAAYLLAPFPSCWCFASVPAEATARAMRAYRDQMTSVGVSLGPDWDAAVAAALAGWIVARGAAISRALDEDREWGTTTVRPRLLTWLRSCTDTAARTGVLPRFRSLTAALHDELSLRWPEATVPGYPAFARPGALLARPPSGWQSG